MTQGAATKSFTPGTGYVVVVDPRPIFTFKSPENADDSGIEPPSLGSLDVKLFKRSTKTRCYFLLLTGSVSYGTIKQG